MNLTPETNIPQNTDPLFMSQPTHNQPAFPQNFTEVEAAAWLKVSRITLQRIRQRGEIAFSRVGGSRIIYTLQNLQEYLARREHPALNVC